jgi:hypothetical protein
MSSQLPGLETRILSAVAHLTANPTLSLRSAAQLFSVPRSTLTRRLAGQLPRKEAAAQHALERAYNARNALTKSEELQVVTWLAKVYDEMGLTLGVSQLRAMGERASGGRVEVGEGWVRGFMERWPGWGARIRGGGGGGAGGGGEKGWGEELKLLREELEIGGSVDEVKEVVWRVLGVAERAVRCVEVLEGMVEEFERAVKGFVEGKGWGNDQEEGEEEEGREEKEGGYEDEEHDEDDEEIILV